MKVKFTVEIEDQYREQTFDFPKLGDMEKKERDETIRTLWTKWAFRYGGYEILEEGE